MREKIQHILFQNNDSLFTYRDMFYHGDWGVLSEEAGNSCLIF